MDPNIPAVPTQPAQPAMPATPPSPKKDHGLILILSFFLIVATAIAALLYFQNQKLVKQLAAYQAQPTPTPLSTEIPSPTPDPTADWKTYSDPKGKYSFKYPSDWTKSNDVGLFN
ncbi:hypothetical protein COX04_01845, partial [Candidatus Woesebacteria bacterium CG22_combo_CG10-13_8_21_14_all_45_10]